jgi:hypothetical protein
VDVPAKVRFVQPVNPETEPSLKENMTITRVSPEATPVGLSTVAEPLVPLPISVDATWTAIALDYAAVPAVEA